MQVALAAAREGVHSLLEMPFCSLLLQGEELSRRGNEEARLNGLKSGFIIFFSILQRKAWELFLSNHFQMVLLEHKDF